MLILGGQAASVPDDACKQCQTAAAAAGLGVNKYIHSCNNCIRCSVRLSFEGFREGEEEEEDGGRKRKHSQNGKEGPL